MQRLSLPRWQTISTMLLSMLMGAIAVLALGTLRERVSFASFAAGLSTEQDAREALSGSLRVGVTYVPAAHAPGDRIYVEEGFEADLAQDIARRLDVAIDVVLVPVLEQVQALAEGRVDVVVTRVGSRDPLHQAADVLPSGYVSGLSPVARSDRPLARWDNLAGKVVCVSEANRHGQDLARALGADVRVLRAPAQALMLVRTGECAAAIHDRVVLDLLFSRMSWQKFSATLPAIEPTPLVVAIAKGREDLVRTISKALMSVGSAAEWQKRRERWASLAAFEVYRDQVVGDCH